MARMVRKQIYLERKTDARLKAEAAQMGISQAELIRRRVSDADPAGVRMEEARQRLLERLKRVREQIKPGAGSGWRFDREQLYLEREDKALPSRHQRPRKRGGPA